MFRQFNVQFCLHQQCELESLDIQSPFGKFYAARAQCVRIFLCGVFFFCWTPGAAAFSFMESSNGKENNKQLHIKNQMMTSFYDFIETRRIWIIQNEFFCSSDSSSFRQPT